MRPNTREAPANDEVHLVWITAGLSFDGDTIGRVENVELAGLLAEDAGAPAEEGACTSSA